MHVRLAGIMSSFGSKRKVRKIAVQDESDEEDQTLSQTAATGKPRPILLCSEEDMLLMLYYSPKMAS